MKSLAGRCRFAIDKYKMINKGDMIAVGVSGGKDSLVLLSLLAELRNYYPVEYELLAVTIDPCFSGSNTDFEAVTDFCSYVGVRHVIKRTELSSLIFDERREKNPCSLCSRMRHGMIHTVAVENGCNKVALGHNLDDAAETFLMNLLNGGRIGCFSPVTYLSRKNLWMVRPLIFCDEQEITSMSKKYKLPVINNGCPVDGKTQRQTTKKLLESLDKEYGDVRKKIIGAIIKGKIDDWGKD